MHAHKMWLDNKQSVAPNIRLTFDCMKKILHWMLIQSQGFFIVFVFVLFCGFGHQINRFLQPWSSERNYQLKHYKLSHRYTVHMTSSEHKHIHTQIMCIIFFNKNYKQTRNQEFKTLWLKCVHVTAPVKVLSNAGFEQHFHLKIYKLFKDFQF